VVHPAYSPDAAPSGFLLYSLLRREIARFIARSPEDVLPEIRRIFEDIPKETLTAAYNNCISALKWTTERNGEYYHID
jgi:hypothetical protein